MEAAGLTLFFSGWAMGTAPQPCLPGALGGGERLYPQNGFLLYQPPLPCPQTVKVILSDLSQNHEHTER